MKTCTVCHVEKELSEFYPHRRMKDGHLKICKSCKKVQSSLHSKTQSGIETERRRNQKPERKALQLVYLQKKRKLFPEKYKANMIVNNAIRDGKLTKGVCMTCGDINVQAHHEDYTKPLEVQWLCLRHHRQKHGQMLD